MPLLRETWGENARSYAAVKNCVAVFKRGDFSTFVAPSPGRPKTMMTSEFIDQILELILEDGQISPKSIAEQLDISRVEVGTIIHERFDMRNLSAKCSRKAWSWIKNCNGACRLRNIWFFFGANQMNSRRE